MVENLRASLHFFISVMIFFLLVMFDAFGCFVVIHFSLIMLVLNIKPGGNYGLALFYDFGEEKKWEFEDMCGLSSVEYMQTK